MPKLNPIERRLNRFLRNPASVRGAMGVIAVATVAVVVAGGALMRLIDHPEYSTIWVGMWWAIQTVTTVGYGDVTPKNPAGRLVAAFVMLEGVAFLAIITAAITSTFVQRASQIRSPDERAEERRVSTHASTNSKRAWSESRSPCGEPCRSKARCPLRQEIQSVAQGSKTPVSNRCSAHPGVVVTQSFHAASTFRHSAAQRDHRPPVTRREVGIAV